MIAYNFKSRDNEKRLLTIRISNLLRNVGIHKNKRQEAEDKAKDYQRKVRELEKINTELEKQNGELQDRVTDQDKQIHKLKDMLFGRSKKSEATENSDLGSSPAKYLHLNDHKERKKPGGRLGHTGYGRASLLPDKTERIFLTACPDCGGKVTRTDSFSTRIVTDIADFFKMLATTTRYEVERQWCGTCQKEVKAAVGNSVKGARIGLNLLSLILIWRDYFHDPMGKITQRLAMFHGIQLSEGEIANMIAQGGELLKIRSQEILHEIRAAPVKHADETSWAIQGNMSWLWLISTDKHTYYQMAESRGKYVAEDLLIPSGGEVFGGVLVRDDYAAYEKLPLKHQSCWAHHLRFSHEQSEGLAETHEAKALHDTLKNIFNNLLNEIKVPFDIQKRQRVFKSYEAVIADISKRVYNSPEALKIQTRVRNQGNHLLTALLHDGCALTNNQAERDIKPFVVSRKISYGSRSWKGADSDAIVSSVIHTIHKQKLPLPQTLRTYLLGKTE